MKRHPVFSRVRWLVTGLALLAGCSGGDATQGAAESDGSAVASRDVLLLSADAGSAGACTATGCPEESVCCAAPLPCAGTCIPDCRVEGAGCPNQGMTCDTATGICLPPSGDGGPPLPVGDGGADCTASGCPEESVCCTAPLPCAGTCIPDCRVEGAGCPNQGMTCDTATGICLPGSGDDTAGDCATNGCPQDNVCCTSPLPCAGICVPDCRLAGASCPAQAPTCDSTTGVCN